VSPSCVPLDRGAYEHVEGEGLADDSPPPAAGGDDLTGDRRTPAPELDEADHVALTPVTVRSSTGTYPAPSDGEIEPKRSLSFRHG
jgi:hypothetical protein